MWVKRDNTWMYTLHVQPTFYVYYTDHTHAYTQRKRDGGGGCVWVCSAWCGRLTKIHHCTQVEGLWLMSLCALPTHHLPAAARRPHPVCRRLPRNENYSAARQRWEVGVGEGREMWGGMMAGDGGLFRTRPCGAGREMHMRLSASFILPARMPPDVISFVFLSGEFRLRWLRVFFFLPHLPHPTDHGKLLSKGLQPVLILHRTAKRRKMSA